MRLAVYMDFRYRREGEATYAEMPFALFLAGLAPWFERLTLMGRLDATPGRLPHVLPHDIEIDGLPYYESAASIADVAAALPRTVRHLWRSLRGVDAVLVFGPHPVAAILVLLALVRRRRVVIGVRQHYPQYVRHRHPGQPLLALAALALEGIWRAYALIVPTVVVGADLARLYRRSPRLLEAGISLVREADVVSLGCALAPTDRSERWVLSVGRLDAEKNPLLLADIAAALERGGGQWRLIVVGDGELADDLRRRVEELGVEEIVELRGYVPVDDGLDRLYSDCDALLHISFTEGFPQVLYEAFAAGLPVVATEVGGVGRGGERSALELIPPADAQAAARALISLLSADGARREEMVAAGLDYVHDHTLESECARVAAFVGSTRAPA